MVGLWKGLGLPAGHPLQCVLETLGWFGKLFTPDMRQMRCRLDQAKADWLPSIPRGHRSTWRFAHKVGRTPIPVPPFAALWAHAMAGWVCGNPNRPEGIARTVPRRIFASCFVASR
ncbi:GXWXG domain-containing protein [Neorhizobium sp. T6_25]|uniref:GXWXG domain-containing protein n=1 Tax=Neorhizobium sp. T6_25 TaxID=2093833 RepID=UPI00352AF77C